MPCCGPFLCWQGWNWHPGATYISKPFQVGARAHQASVQKLAQCPATVCWLTTENYPPVPSRVLSDLISTDRLGVALSCLPVMQLQPPGAQPGTERGRALLMGAGAVGC